MVIPTSKSPLPFSKVGLGGISIPALNSSNQLVIFDLIAKLNHTVRDIPVGKDKASERDLLVIKIEGNSRCCSPFFRHPVVSHQFLRGYLDKNFILPFAGK